MNPIFKSHRVVTACLFTFLCGCSQGEKEKVEGSEYEQMVMNEEEECEWTTGQEDKKIAGELVPEPQEVLFSEKVESVTR